MLQGLLAAATTVAVVTLPLSTWFAPHDPHRGTSGPGTSASIAIPSRANAQSAGSDQPLVGDRLSEGDRAAEGTVWSEIETTPDGLASSESVEPAPEAVVATGTDRLVGQPSLTLPPPDAAEVVVHVGQKSRRSVTGLVELQPAGEWPVDPSAFDAGDHPQEWLTNDGEACFEHVPSGSHVVLVRARNDTVFQCRLFVEKNGNHEVRFEVGETTVRGTVFGDNGDPLEGARVKVELDQEDGTVAVVARTDDAGAYVIDGVPGGFGRFSVDVGDASGSPRQLIERRVLFHVRGVHNLDCGSPVKDLQLSGTLQTSGQELVVGGKLHAIETRRGTRVTSPVDDQGEFQIVLFGGSWNLSYEPKGGRGPESEIMLVEGWSTSNGKRTLSLELDGARITGRLFDREGREALVPPPAGQIVSLQRTPGGPVLRTTPVDSRGSYAFEAVPFGIWYLDASPHGPGAPVRVLVLENADRVELDLLVE